MASTWSACCSVIGSMRTCPAPPGSIMRLRFQAPESPATSIARTRLTRSSAVLVAERLAQLRLLRGRQVGADELRAGVLELGLHPVHDSVRAEQEQRRGAGDHLLAHPVDEFAADPDVGEGSEERSGCCAYGQAEDRNEENEA